jgi:hypothetical protein
MLCHAVTSRVAIELLINQQPADNTALEVLDSISELNRKERAIETVLRKKF